jgi:hypothetical protein
MSKRIRTQLRFDQLYDLAMKRHASGWTDKRSDEEFQRWTNKNPDLVAEGAITTARYEYRKMADPKLSGSLPQITAVRSIVEQIQLVIVHHKFGTVGRL